MANGKNSRNRAGSGIALVAAAAAAAGAYFLYGKNGPRNRQKVRGWAVRVRGEVLERMEKMKEMNEGAYQGIIQSVARRYETLKNVDPAELGQLVSELKSYWQNISAQIKKGRERSPSSQKPTVRRRPSRVSKNKNEAN